MMSDSRGDMGFAEAMLAVMTVSVVLMMYIGSVSTAVQLEDDPLEDIDPDLLTAEVQDGRVVFGACDYLERFRSVSELGGLSITLNVPGGFAPAGQFFSQTLGEQGGSVYSRTFSKHIPADNGRAVVAVIGVNAWR